MNPTSPGTPVWRCQLDELTGTPEAAPLNSLTVGSKFQLNCKGDIAIAWNGPARLHFAKEEQKYDLMILQTVKQESTEVSYIVTSYRAGDFKPEFIRVITGDLTSGGSGFEAYGLTWKVQSVLPKDKKPEAYPSVGPFLMGVPYWIWGIVLVVALLIGLIIYRLVRRSQQRKKVLRMLKEHGTALTPHSQFHKDLRQIKKAIERQEAASEIARKLDNEVRLYFLRTFQIPALDWSNSAILRDLRKKSPWVYDSEAKRLTKVFRELSELKKSDQIKTQDLEQMFVLGRDAVDRVEKLRGLK